MPSLPNLSPPGNRKYRWYGLIKEGQEDFSGGAFFGQERVPANGCEDIINGFVDQDGGIARRGGSTLYGPTISTTGPAFWLWDGYLAAGRRTIQGRYSDTFMLNSAESAWAARGTGTDRARPVAVGGMLAVPRVPSAGSAGVGFVGSNFTTPSNPTGTITVTKDSVTVTGTGTNFLSTVQPGSLIVIIASGRTMAVQSVESDTSLTLARAAAASGSALAPVTDFRVQTTSVYGGPALKTNTLVAAHLGVASDRLLAGAGTRVAFSGAGDPSVFAATDFHEMPTGSLVTGIQGIRDSALVFTTNGVFVIRNLAYDLTDAQGNVQQQLQPLHPDLVLWDDMALTGWSGSVIAPCTDGVYLVDGANSPVGLLNEAILPLYRGYVQAGYVLGTAAVFGSRYFLPILAYTPGTETPPVTPAITWIDTLVCDLPKRAWSRFDGYGGKTTGFARRATDNQRSPRLLGTNESGSAALTELTKVFTPDASVKNDADGSTHQLKVTFRTLTAGTIPVQWRKFRVRFEADDTVLFSTHFSQGLVTGTPITSLPIVAALTAVPAGSTLIAQSSDGLHTQTWVTTAPLNIGDVSVAVASQAPNFAYGTLSTLSNPGAGTDDPQLQAEFATGRPGNAFTTLSGLGPEGETTFNWQTSKKARAIRYRVTSLHAASRFVIRSFESFYRYTGRT